MVVPTEPLKIVCQNNQLGVQPLVTQVYTNLLITYSEVVIVLLKYNCVTEVGMFKGLRWLCQCFFPCLKQQEWESNFFLGGGCLECDSQ